MNLELVLQRADASSRPDQTNRRTYSLAGHDVAQELLLETSHRDGEVDDVHARVELGRERRLRLRARDVELHEKELGC